MNACQLSLSGMDVQACLTQIVSPLTGAIASDFWWVQYWPWAVGVIVAIGVLWLLDLAKGALGTPGEVGMAALLGGVAVAILDRTVWAAKPAPRPPATPKPATPTRKVR